MNSCKLLPFSEATLPEPLVEQVLELVRESVIKITLDDFGGECPPGLTEIQFYFDHMVRLGYFQVSLNPVLHDDDEYYDLSDVNDLRNERLHDCTWQAEMRSGDVLALFSDELLQFFESHSIILTCNSVPLTQDFLIPIGCCHDS